MIDLCDRSTTETEGPIEDITGEIIELIPGVGPIFIGIYVESDAE